MFFCCMKQVVPEELASGGFEPHLSVRLQCARIQECECLSLWVCEVGRGWTSVRECICKTVGKDTGVLLPWLRKRVEGLGGNRDAFY